MFKRRGGDATERVRFRRMPSLWPSREFEGWMGTHPACPPPVYMAQGVERTPVVTLADNGRGDAG